jgi:hypothetical protein
MFTLIAFEWYGIVNVTYKIKKHGNLLINNNKFSQKEEKRRKYEDRINCSGQ